MLPEFPTSPSIGVFDSGLGGLSVLRHIRALLPHEDLLYFADTDFAPYGGRLEHEIIERSLAVTDFLIQQNVKALVVACNTATAAAITVLRAQYPSLPLVGVEPGLKPAAALTRTKIVGVLATERTLASAKFAALHDKIVATSDIRFLAQPCVGLVDQIEKGELQSAATALLIKHYVQPLVEQGADTLVLGCTHYPFVQPLIEDAANASGRPTAIVDTGEAVAKQLAHLLSRHNLQQLAKKPGVLRAYTTGGSSSLEVAFERLLHIRLAATQIATRNTVKKKST